MLFDERFCVETSSAGLPTVHDPLQVELRSRMNGGGRAAPAAHMQRRPPPAGGSVPSVQGRPGTSRLGDAPDSTLGSSFSEMDTEDSFSDSELLSDFDRNFTDSEDNLSELEDNFGGRHSYLDMEDSFSESELQLDSFSDSEDFVSDVELWLDVGDGASDCESQVDIADSKVTLGPVNSLGRSRSQALPLRQVCPVPAGRTGGFRALRDSVPDGHVPRCDQSSAENLKRDQLSPRSTPRDKRAQFHKAPSPKPPAGPRRAPTVKGNAPPTSPISRGEPGLGTAVSPKSDGGSAKGDVSPPLQSLSLCFQKVESSDWKEKVDGLKSIQTLMKQQPQQVKSRLREVCVVVTEEVKNLRFAVVCSAIDTLRELHLHFGTSMDHMAAVTGKALLLKVNKSATKSICQQANAALDALVRGCSPGTVLTTLLSTGLCHRDPAVRGSTAQHLFQLTHIVTGDWIFGDGVRFAHRFFNAVSKMSQDAAPEVRHFGKKILQEHATHKHFLSLWNKFVPENERRTVVLPHLPRQNTVT